MFKQGLERFLNKKGPSTEAVERTFTVEDLKKAEEAEKHVISEEALKTIQKRIKEIKKALNLE